MCAYHGHNDRKAIVSAAQDGRKWAFMMTDSTRAADLCAIVQMVQKGQAQLPRWRAPPDRERVTLNE